VYVSTVSGSSRQDVPLAGDAYSASFDATDRDDGIHIVSIARLGRPNGRVLRVVVAWFEGGRWVQRTVELPDQ
jgi:hypothetical protein